MISGYTIASDVVDRDYCITECVESLSAICDEVVVGYSPSSDSTGELLSDLCYRIPNLRIVAAPVDFSVRNGGPMWMINWMNDVRKQLKGNYQVYLDADEVIDPLCADEIRDAERRNRALVCTRLNFWGRLDRIAPSGHFCGHKVIRCAPTKFMLPSDFPVGSDICPVITQAHRSDVRIFHYCTLRKPDAFHRKSLAFQPTLVGTYDQRIDAAMKADGHWSDQFTWKEPFINFEGKHPPVAHRWLRERGYEPA